MSNKTSGNRFEEEFAKFLFNHGFWCHVMQQKKEGQPADIIAVYKSYHVLIDCKEVSTKRGFALSRVEENQRNAMHMFERRGGHIGWFAVKYPDGTVRMISLQSIELLAMQGVKAITETMAEKLFTADGWMEEVKKVWGDKPYIQQ